MVRSPRARPAVRWMTERNSVPADLLELWLTFGGGVMFETEEILALFAGSYLRVTRPTTSSISFWGALAPTVISASSVHSPLSLIRKTDFVLISPREKPQLKSCRLPAISHQSQATGRRCKHAFDKHP